MTDSPKRRDCDRVDERVVNIVRSAMREVEKNGNGNSWRPRLDRTISVGSVINFGGAIITWVVLVVFYMGGIEQTIAVVQNEIKHLWVSVGELKASARDR